MNGETVKLSFAFVNFFEWAKFKLEKGISSGRMIMNYTPAFRHPQEYNRK